jgi:hypothetical protein
MELDRIKSIHLTHTGILLQAQLWHISKTHKEKPTVILETRMCNGIN